MITVNGYDILGTTPTEGLRFAWRGNRFGNLVESAAFNTRTKLGGEPVCAYTTSVSAGCVLRTMGCPCLFCRTGKVLPFGGLLTYKEIAKQNIFMVLADMHCDDHPELAVRPREFAYMGQGEPGYSYPQVRMAIELTNHVMKKLGQTVYRHIFSTSGIPEAINAYKEDLQHYYSEKVTLHLSLHAAGSRSLLMPVNNIYPLAEVLEQINGVFDISGDKTCVGIMLFWHFRPRSIDLDYSNTETEVASLLEMLDPLKYRLSFCEFNPYPDLGEAEVYPSCKAEKLMALVKSRRFEAKLFSSFGRAKQTACGMLGGRTPERIASAKWKELDAMAEKLINESL